MTRRNPTWIAGLMCLALAACGGGGGGGGEPINLSPVASFTATPNSGPSPLTVQVDAAASTDRDGSIVRYDWVFGDGGTATGATASHVFRAVGTYTVSLTVTDNQGARASASRTISVINLPPVASFSISADSGPSPLTVVFDAAASTDPDGTIADYRWDFDDCTTGDSVTANRVFRVPGVYRVTLAVRDNLGAESTSVQTLVVSPPATVDGVAISGRVTFERVPFGAGTDSGLSYVATFEAPARHVVTELVRVTDQAVLATSLTDELGNYSLIGPSNTDVRVRARVFSRSPATTIGSPGWALCVRNNTNSDALYVLDSSDFNTGISDRTLNLMAETGWSVGFGPGSYTDVRAAAPFAVLDTLYAATQFVISQGDSGAHFPPLSAYWDENNRPTQGTIEAGQIGSTSYYPVGSDGVAPGIYILGAENNDTDEFDQHVIAHEFLHYLEDAVSRTDTTGGPHSPNERLDMRLAFSEGYGNAFSGMVLGDPVYRDSIGAAQASGFSFSLESRGTTTAGWFNETTVQRVIWDLFDSTADGGDAVSLGYGPLHDVFTTELKEGVPLTSLFPFITALKLRPDVPAAAVDALVEHDTVGPDFGVVSVGMTAYATTETHDGGSDASLPVYTSVAVGGQQTVCADRLLGTYNALGNRRFLRFSLPGSQAITIRVSCTATAGSSCTGTPTPDPDFVLTRASARWIAEELGTTETLGPLALDAGDYVLEVYEYSHVDPFADSTDRRDRTCMTVNITG